MLYIVSLDINNNSESDFKLEELKKKIDDMATETLFKEIPPHLQATDLK